MDFDLSEELAVLRSAVARFASERVAPHAQAWDRAESYPDEMIQVLGRQGFMGVLVPEEYGGAGGDHMQLAIVLEEIARHDGGLALAVEAHNGLCCRHILIAGTPEQKKRWLPALASGDQIGSWCLSEPASGTDAAAMKTRALRDGDAWVLNGSKQFVTNGARAGTFIVLAVTDPSKGKSGISAFILESDIPGLGTGKPEDKLGMRSSDTVSLTLEDVRVPEDQLLGVVGEAFGDVERVLLGGRIMISALALGLARGALEDSARYASERETFGKPIARRQLIQAKLADMATQGEAARALLYRAIQLLDQGKATAQDAAITKLFVSEMATKACLEAIQVHGGYGYLRDFNVERYFRDAKLCEIGEGTSEILRVIIARSVVEEMGSP
jgi:alkylation response protein AidB-like acyl-CoA dehydrogenase